MPISLTTINTDEVLRYMGTPPDQAGADLRALAEIIQERQKDRG